MKLLFVGESWRGSCARSLKEALSRRAGVVIDEINEDLWFPKPTALWLRAISRLTEAGYRRELGRAILGAIRRSRPDAVIAYKGTRIDAATLAALKQHEVLTVNVYPDCSPLAHGPVHARAVGAYDLVISTKPYHPALWGSTYGYRNRCEFVPQGYDPALHLVPEPPQAQDFDVALVATWRAEYGRLMRELARHLAGENLRVIIGGHGWEARRGDLPSSWRFVGGVLGRQYVDLLRSGRICIAPVTREISVNGRPQPGDVDTTRTYELAAAHCFFIHRRTDFVKTLYDEASEVPMFSDATELASHIRRYLVSEPERKRMAAAAHARAVPGYSLDLRAQQILGLVRGELTARHAASDRREASR